MSSIDVHTHKLFLYVTLWANLYEAIAKRNVALNTFPNKPWFLHVCSRSLLKTLWEKEKLLVTSNLSFSYSVFYLFGEFSAVFIKLKIVVCKL